MLSYLSGASQNRYEDMTDTVGELQPSPEGISMNLSKLDDVIDGLTKARLAISDRGRD